MRIVLCIIFVVVHGVACALHHESSVAVVFKEYHHAYLYALQQKNLFLPIEKFKQKFLISIDSKKQTLSLYMPNGILLRSYTISTSKKGLGQLFGSYKTPVGLHQIVEKIGHDVPHYGIFRHRQFTNQIWQQYLVITDQLNKKIITPHKKDFIVTRILRIQGLQPGVNYGKDHQGKNVDSLARGIYIHGTTMEWKLGKPTTIGCIYLSSKDIVELFDIVPLGCLVMIY